MTVPFNFGTPPLDLTKFGQTLYVQRRYMAAIGIREPVFVFTVTPTTREEVEATILRYYKTMFGDSSALIDAARNPHASILRFDLPAWTKWHLPPMHLTILLLDEANWTDGID